MDNYSSKYDNFILHGDLNSDPTESAVRDFCEIYSCKNLVNSFMTVCSANQWPVFYMIGASTMKELNSIIQMTSENRDLEFGRFKAAIDETFKNMPHEKAVCLSKPSAFHE